MTTDTEITALADLADEWERLASDTGWAPPYRTVWQSCAGQLRAAIADHDKRVAIRVLRDAAAAIYNGAGHPEQEFYDHGVSPWLSARADAIEFGGKS